VEKYIQDLDNHSDPCRLLLGQWIMDLAKGNMNSKDTWARNNMSKSDLIQYQKNLDSKTKSKNTCGDQRIIDRDS